MKKNCVIVTQLVGKVFVSIDYVLDVPIYLTNKATTR